MNVRNDILIVDDQLDNLRLLTEILAGEGYKVRKVVDGQHALDAAQLVPPDLILLDIMMPNLDGYEVCQQLKADPRTQAIPVIFLSALNDVADKVRAFAGGGVDYITKPFQKDEVLARVQTHLKIQNLTTNLQAQNTFLTQEIERREATEIALRKALENLKAAQEQIIAREKLAALGTLTAGVAHELRNPLNFVNNYAEGSIELTDELSAELEGFIDRLDQVTLDTVQDLLSELKQNAVSIYQNGQRAEHIINSMMQHARVKEGSLRDTDLNALLDEAVGLAYHSKRVQSFEFTATIEKDYAPDLSRLQCFPSELSRAFINIVDNAFYAIDKKRQTAALEYIPTLSLKTCQQDNRIEIRIQDNGTGISPEHYFKIFEPFFTTKPTDQGTGLGLSMTYEIIVSQHRGTLQVETKPGVFTEFIVTLPIALQESDVLDVGK
jgi:signal transduction histidine kinase